VIRGVTPDKKTVAALKTAVERYTSTNAAATALGISRSVLQNVCAGLPVRRGSLLQVEEALKTVKLPPKETVAS